MKNCACRIAAITSRQNEASHMTTIATDGVTIAADTQMQGRWRDAVRVQKVHYINGDLVGGAGDVAEIDAFKQWYADGADQDNKPQMDDSFVALVLTPEGECYYFYHKLCPIKVGTPYAIGSGAEFAMGAMLAGASPEEAVLIAAQLDNGTNDDIVVMGFETVKREVEVSRVKVISGSPPDWEDDEDGEEEGEEASGEGASAETVEEKEEGEEEVKPRIRKMPA
jgi:ATP-dependent protease HslVU (ClpYQ) peptidase subunit